jgi:transcriptional regulator with XRE-family HTH domain
MKQPDLGKKIAELRKAKGLTQDELVQKCNLNVRTLQRIESGEVEPRSYTIKIIFAALDESSIYESAKGFSDKLEDTKLVIFNWLGQVYKYVSDLFNLKTNTMKKLSILSIPFLTISLVLILLFNSNAKAQAKLEIRQKFEQACSNPNYLRWFNTGHIDSVAMQYKENACFMPDQYQTINNRKGINDYYMQLYNRGLRFSKVETLAVVFSDSIAIERGTWETTLLEIPVAKGSYLTQWHYVDGEWWIENEMSKTDEVAFEGGN